MFFGGLDADFSRYANMADRSIKALAHWLTTGLPLVLAAPFLGVLLNLPVPGFFWLVISLLVGTPAMSVIGTFGAALTVGLKRGGLLLSLLVLQNIKKTKQKEANKTTTRTTKKDNLSYQNALTVFDPTTRVLRPKGNLSSLVD